MHVFPATAPIRFFPFGKVRIPQVIFFVLYIEVSLQLHSQRTRAPELRGEGSPLGRCPRMPPLWGRRGQATCKITYFLFDLT